MNALGYAALPVNLAAAGYAQLRKVPGAQLPATAAEFLQTCGGNRTISPDGTDALSASDPMPQSCDRPGPAQCAPALATTTTLAGPDRVPVDTIVTLNATVAPAAAGTVQFLDGGAPLQRVPVRNGAAQISTVLPPGTHSITASFAPADPAAFQPSESDPITVTVSGGEPPGETITVDTPLSEGVLTMTVDSAPVRLSTAELRADHTFESFGELGAVTISDGRDQTRPGWSVSGQIGDFTDGTHTFGGGYLGWTPAVRTPNAAGDVAAGAPVSPGANPGLEAGGVLATAPAAGGLGTTVLSAGLHLRIPSSTQPGLYSATLTITALTNG